MKKKNELKKSHAKCGLCGRKLQAVPKSPRNLLKASKTEKRPERKFGGVLCATCVETILKEKTRLSKGAIQENEVPLTHLKYIKMLK